MFKNEYDKIVFLIEDIREFINDDEILEFFVEGNKIEWDLLTASLDTIEDTVEGINSFKIDDIDDIGGNYLQIYGVLQCFYVLQDSLKSLRKSFNTYGFVIDDIDFSNSLTRKIRNDIIGHPTTRRNGEKSLIIRPTISNTSLKYIKRDNEGNSLYDNIFNYSCIIEESKDIIGFLEKLSRDIVRQRYKSGLRIYRYEDGEYNLG